MHVSFSSSKSSPNTQMGLQAACAVHFLSKGSLCVALTPLNIPEQPAWAGLQLQRLSYGEPAGSSLLRAFLRLAPAEVRVWLHPAPGPFQNTTMGLHCMQDTWGSLPCVLEETLRTVIRHPPPPRCLQWTWECPHSDSFTKRWGLGST